jgi:hypothetical protein
VVIPVEGVDIMSKSVGLEGSELRRHPGLNRERNGQKEQSQSATAKGLLHFQWYCVPPNRAAIKEKTPKLPLALATGFT